MKELEIVATFESDETARSVAKALNNWFHWIMEVKQGEIDINEGGNPDFFEDFGVSLDDYPLDFESDVDWTEAPLARSRGPRITIALESVSTSDTLQELLEALGAYEVTVSEDDLS